MKDDQRSLMEMIRDAKCTRFSVPNRHLQPVITTMKQPKVEEIHINGDQVMILKQKKWSLISQLSLRWEKSKVLMGGELFYFNQN
jgi:hypothetical protein